MLDDLLGHELEVVKAFFARGLAWAATEAASESASLSGASEETIEGVVFHPHGPHNFEQIVIRSVVNELNSLCEFALQNTWRSLTNGESLPNGELVFTAGRGTIEKALLSRGEDVKGWARWDDVLKLKELSEGFKHRQRLQPFPKELQRPGFEWRAARRFDPANADWIAPYELGASHAAELISAVDELLRWLRNKQFL